MRNGLPRAATLTPPVRGYERPRAPMPRSRAGAPRALPPKKPLLPKSSPPMNNPAEDRRQWPLYEVFIRARGGLDHKHVGSLHASDARMAIDHARDLYRRRQEGVSIWVVPSVDITA